MADATHILQPLRSGSDREDYSPFGKSQISLFPLFLAFMRSQASLLMAGALWTDASVVPVSSSNSRQESKKLISLYKGVLQPMMQLQ